MNYKKFQKGITKLKVISGKCSLCGNSINLQIHHLSYNPEIFVVLCKNCHEGIHKHTTGKVQKFTKYGYEDFRDEHKEEVKDVKDFFENYISNGRMLSKAILKDKMLMKILYGFGPIRETKKKIMMEWLEIKVVLWGFREMENLWREKKNEILKGLDNSEGEDEIELEFEK